MENNTNQNNNTKQIIIEEKQEKSNDNANIIETNNNQNSDNKSNQKEKIENNTSINPTLKTGESDINNTDKRKNLKYRLNFSVIIHYLRNKSDKEDSKNEIEFKSNILLMSSQIYQSNKISVLTLLSFIN